MRSKSITIRLSPNLSKRLACMARQTGRSQSDIVREVLRRHLSLLRFAELRRRTLPFAEARGYFTDEDIAHIVRIERR